LGASIKALVGAFPDVDLGCFFGWKRRQTGRQSNQTSDLLGDKDLILGVGGTHLVKDRTGGHFMMAQPKLTSCAHTWTGSSSQCSGISSAMRTLDLKGYLVIKAYVDEFVRPK
jgi:hypothetical protein